MSHIPSSHDVVVIPEGQAATVGGVPVTGRLYVGSSAAGSAGPRHLQRLLGAPQGTGRWLLWTGAGQVSGLTSKPNPRGHR